MDIDCTLTACVSNFDFENLHFLNFFDFGIKQTLQCLTELHRAKSYNHKNVTTVNSPTIDLKNFSYFVKFSAKTCAIFCILRKKISVEFTVD